MSLKALSDYTFYSRYSQYNEKKNRRETWHEAVSRLFKMHRIKYAKEIEKYPELEDLITFAEEQQKKKHVLASQRSLQFAIDPILKHELKMFNCLTTHINRERVFQETMYALLCGCGAGFSVQYHHINQLGKVKIPEIIEPVTYVIEDSIEGWADAVGVLMASWFVNDFGEFSKYRGRHIEFDYSNIRPEGDLIAGRYKAPGPNGLKTSLEKIRDLLLRESVNYEHDFYLRPIDAYDIIMHISDAVLSGGVRRSATLCMFSKDDTEMLNAKTGMWFVENPQRGRSNNSAALLKGTVSEEEFSKMMKSTKEFGEPGFIWVDDLEIIFNPCCVSENTIIATSNGLRKVKDLIGEKFKAVVNGKEYNSLSNGFFKSGEKEIFKLSLKEGFELLVTKDHKILTKNRDWVEAQHLTDVDEIIINNHSNNKWDGFGNHNQGWLVGSLLGDGTFDKNNAILEYWGDESEYLPEEAIEKIYKEQLNTYQTIKGNEQTPTINGIKKKRISSVGLKNLAEKVGISKNKIITDEILYTSSDFIKGFLSGWFDADGSVQGNHEKGISIRLTSSNLENLKKAQLFLLQLNIFSKIYEQRLPEGYRNMPNGKGGHKKYLCKAIHEIVISNEDIIKFNNIIGFYNREKALKLNNLINSYKRNPNKSKFIGKLKSFEFSYIEDVYDCTIEDVHAFDANGIYVHNCEIGMIPTTLNGQSGWQSCNLTEINGKYCDTEEHFIKACEASAIIGTLQAGYTELKYLTPASKEIFEQEALLGCSITGWMDNPEILFDPEIQKRGAKKILEINEKVANMININVAARATCVKPAGSTSCVLGTASGIHPHHAKRYIRRAQVNRTEFCGQVIEQKNPLAVEKSVWSANGTDNVISFVCEVPQGAITKNQISALELLEKVKLTQQNWVEYGTREDKCMNPKLRHNVSNTINVKDNEWGDVEKFIFDNQNYFAGISLLAASGDLDYAQAPFSTVLTPNELVREYGDASVFASGLVVDGLHAFEDNLWEACNTVLGIGQTLEDELTEPEYPTSRNYKGLALYFEEKENYEKWFLKKDWLRRVNQFAERYFENNLKKATYCLKHVSLWKTWCDLKREYVDIDWTEEKEERRQYQNADEQAAAACAGGKCLLEV